MKPVKERAIIIRNPSRTQRNNLVKCPKCSMSLFNEELSVHECLDDKKIVEYNVYETYGEYHVYDGRKGYHWSLHQPNCNN
jgi:hypothetical protein